MKPLCKTCWVERHTAFDDLNQLYKPLPNCLKLIQSNSDPNNWFDAKSTTQAAGLLKQLQDLPFIISFHACHYLFGIMKEHPKQLQGSTIEIAKAYEMVSLATEQLDSTRLNQATEFKAIFRKYELMTNFSNVSLAVLRTVQCQTMRSNVEHNSPEEYFRRSIFLPFLDGLLQELQYRFQGKSKDCIKAIVLVPSNLQDCDVEAVNTINSF